jgi:hypothetical protein
MLSKADRVHRPRLTEPRLCQTETVVRRRSSRPWVVPPPHAPALSPVASLRQSPIHFLFLVKLCCPPLLLYRYSALLSTTPMRSRRCFSRSHRVTRVPPFSLSEAVLKPQLQASVGTLKTGYHVYKLQVKMKDKTDAHACVSRGSHLLAQGSSGAVTCLVTPAPATRLEAAPGPLRASWPRLLAQDSSEATTCPLGSIPRLLAQDNSEAATCLVGGSCGL